MKYIECPIRFGLILAKGPHPIFENEVKLHFLHKTEGAETFNNLKKSIESLGTLQDAYCYEDGKSKIYKCRINYVDFALYYQQTHVEVPEPYIDMSITKIPSHPIDHAKFPQLEIAVEEYLLFQGESFERVSFTNGITETPSDVKELFGTEKGIWVNHSNKKIGFTANGYCSIYSTDDISKIIFVDSIGRYKEPKQFIITLKNGEVHKVFRDGDWTALDETSRHSISQLTGLPIEDQLVDNTYMDHDDWGYQDH